MTDEEMAEEYAETQNLQNVNPSGIVRCKIADGFLAGLKAGRPQWHDLREYPNDLPKVNGQYWVCYEDSVNIGRKGHEMWIFINGKWEHTAKVIAWCEIPTFDKE